MKSGIAVLVACVAVALVSCAKAPSDTKVEHWVIIGHAMPGVSAMSDQDAAKWHGRSIDLGPDLAIAGPDSCEHPLYESGPAPGDSVMQSFNAAPGSLGAAWPPGATVTLLRTFCNGETWYSPGAILIKTSPSHAYAPWEGVFFELERR